MEGACDDVRRVLLARSNLEGLKAATPEPGRTLGTVREGQERVDKKIRGAGAMA